MNSICKYFLDRKYLIFFIASLVTFFFACLNFYYVEESYSSSISYSVQVKTNNTQFKTEPVIYFNNDKESPNIGKTLNNIIVFDNIPSEIDVLRLSFTLPNDTKVQISDVGIFINCREFDENCKKIFSYDINNNFETWMKAGLKVENNQIVSNELESVLIWGQKKLRLDAIASEKGFEIPKYNFKSLVMIILLLICSVSTFAYHIYLIRNNHNKLKNTIIAFGSLGIFCLYLISAFPGHTNYDEYFSLNEFWNGVLSDTHPPMQTLLWSGSMALSNILGLGNALQTSTLLVFILLVLLFSTYLIATKLKSSISVLILYLLFISPYFLVNIPHIGKDTILAVSLLFSCVCLYYFHKNHKLSLMLTALVFIIIAYGSRHNAPAAVIPVIIYFTINLYKSMLKNNNFVLKKFALINKVYVFVPLTSVLIILIVYSSNVIINKTFIKNTCCAGSVGLMTPMHDLIGMSYYGQDLLVPEKYLKTPSTYLDYVNKTYPTLFDFNGIKNLTKDNTNHILSTWVSKVTENPYLYLDHRIDILKRFFGFTNKYNPYEYSSGFYTHTITKENINVQEKFEFVTRLDATLVKAQDEIRTYVGKFRNTVLFKPWFYIFIATLSMLIFRKKNNLDQLATYMYLSSFFYLAPYILVVNSSTIRYAYWPILCTLFIFVIKLDTVLNLKKKTALMGR